MTAPRTRLAPVVADCVDPRHGPNCRTFTYASGTVTHVKARVIAPVDAAASAGVLEERRAGRFRRGRTAPARRPA